MRVHGTVTGLSYSADGRELLVLQTDRSVRAFAVENAAQRGHWPGQSVCSALGRGFAGGSDCRPRACAVEMPFLFLPGGRQVVTATERGLVVCELAGGAALTRAGPAGGSSPNALGSSADGTVILVGNDDGSVHVFDGPSAARRLPARLSPVMALVGEGAVILSVTADGKLLRADRRTGQLLSSVSVLMKGRASAGCVGEVVQAAAFSRDGRLALVASGAGNGPRTDCPAVAPHVRLLDSAHGQLLWELPDSSVWSAAFSPDGTEVALAAAVHPEDRNEPNPMQVVRVGVKTGLPVDPETGHRAAVTAVVFSPDGQRAASGDGQGMLRLWNVASGAQLAARQSAAGAVSSVAFSPDSRSLLVQTEDDATLLFQAPSGQLLQTVVAAPKTADFDSECRARAANAPKARVDPKHGAASTSRPPLPLQDTDDAPVSSVLAREAVWLNSRETLVPVAGESCVGLEGHCNYGCERTYSLVRAVASTGKVLQRFESIDEELLGRCNRRPDVILTQASSGGVHLWGEDGKLRATFGGELGKVLACDATPDGSRLLLVTRSSLALVDGRTFRQLELYKRSGARGGDVALSADGTRALDISGSRLRLLHLPGGEVLETLPLGLYEDLPTAVAFSPDGASFLVGTARGLVLQFTTRAGL